MSKKVVRQFGKPFTRCTSCIPPHEAPSDAITGDSHDFLIDPVEGKLVRRKGSANIGGMSGILETIATGHAMDAAYCRRILPAYSPIDLQQIHTALFTSQNTSGSTLLGDGGQVYFRGGSANHVIGDDFGVTHYPANFKAVPFVSKHTLSGTTRVDSFQYERMTTAQQRAHYASGAANMLELGDSLYTPGYNTVPRKWNKRFNVSSVAGTENLRVFPVGVVPPCYEIKGTFSQEDTKGPWPQGQFFAVATVFEMKDGSRSMPGPLPRHAQPGIHAGYHFGMLQATGITASTYANRVSLTQIPIGPDGVARRHIVASPVAATDPEVNVFDLRLWFTIENNTETSAVMTAFNLTADPLLVRFDHTWMPPAKFMWTGDQRAWCGRTRQHPAAIVICPPASQCNTVDETINGTFSAYKVVNDGTLAGSSLTIAWGASTKQFIFTTYPTIQQLVDEVNSQLSGDAWKDWRCQLVPGADPMATTLSLLATPTDQTGDQSVAGNNYIRCYSNAFPGILYTQSTYISSHKDQDRRVFFTVGGPGAPAMAGDQWVAGNYRTAPERLGVFLGGGNSLKGQVCVFTGGIAIIQNKYGGGTGQDEDYRMFTLNDRRGGLNADSIVSFNGVVGYLTDEGYVICDGEREVCISGDHYNPSTKTGLWTAAIQLAIEQVGTRSEYRPTFFASVWEGRLYASYRTTVLEPSIFHTTVYDLSANSESGGIESVLNGGKPWGWSSEMTWNSGADASMSVGAIGAVPTVGGYAYYGSNDLDLWSATKGGRIDQLFTGYFDGDAIKSALVEVFDPGLANILEASDGQTSTFGNVAVGAIISDAGAGVIPVGTTVISKNHLGDPRLLVMSNDAIGGASSELPITFSGLLVQARGFCAMDMAQTSHRKSAQRLTCYYKSPNGSMGIDVSRDINRASKRSLTLPVTAGAFSRVVKEMPTRIRSNGIVFEPCVTDTGDGATPSEFWGAEAELEISEGPK